LYDPNHVEKRNHAVNADGFGLASYDSHHRLFASLFKSVTPAWSNQNLAELCEVQYTDLLFAHIRAASPKMLVSESNCHPFRRGQFVFMHNGGISGFGRIRRRMLSTFNDAVFRSIRGSTDSEHAFALFLTQFHQEDVMGPEAAPDMMPAGELKRLSPEQFARGLRLTIVRIMEFQKNAGMTYDEAASSLNFAVSDGQCICVSRCRTHSKHDPPTVYYCRSNKNTNEKFDIKCHSRSPMQCNDGSSNGGSKCSHNGTSTPTSPSSSSTRRSKSSRRSTPPHQMHAISEVYDRASNSILLESDDDDGTRRAIIISSEPLDYIADKWELVPKDHMLLVCGASVKLINLRLPNWEDIGTPNLELTPCIRPQEEMNNMLSPSEVDAASFSLDGGLGLGLQKKNATHNNNNNNSTCNSKTLLPRLNIASVKQVTSSKRKSKMSKRKTLLLNRKDRHVGTFSRAFPLSPRNNTEMKHTPSNRSNSALANASSASASKKKEDYSHPTAQRMRRNSEESRKKQQEFKWQQQLRRTVLTSIAVGATCLIVGTIVGTLLGRWSSSSSSSSSSNTNTMMSDKTGRRGSLADAIVSERHEHQVKFTEEMPVFDSPV